MGLQALAHLSLFLPECVRVCKAEVKLYVPGVDARSGWQPWLLCCPFPREALEREPTHELSKALTSLSLRPSPSMKWG